MSYTLEDQIKLEEQYKEYAQELFRSNQNKQEEKGRANATQIGKGLLKHIGMNLHSAVSEWLEDELKPRRGVQKTYKKMLQYLVDSIGKELVIQNACAFVFEKVINAVMNSSIKKAYISNIASAVGRALYYECRLEAYMAHEVNFEKKKEITKEIKQRDQFRYKWNVIEEITSHDITFEYYKATNGEFSSVGLELIQVLKNSTGLIEEMEAGIKNSIQVIPTEYLIELWRANVDHVASKVNLNTPTIIPPKPWTTIFDGAYYSKPMDFMRIPWLLRKARTTKNYLYKLQEVDLSEVMSAVNRIQETAYRINKEILEVVNYYVAQGGDIVGLERLEPYEKLPFLVGETDLEVIKAHKKNAKDLVKKEIARKSKALRMFKTIGFAKQFAKYDTIYFPCNIDFRGRVYPIPYFSHQGDDLMKSLLLYVNPVPAQNEEDLQTLQIQGSNLWGNDKIGYKAQCEWIEEHTQDIKASAEEPLSYTWWQQADEPLQFLAFCKEYKKALDYLAINGSIIGFTCHIPIAFDGTCSGLQHYSAMLQDTIGGNAVNLTCGHSTPNDIYKDVADKVLELVKEDAENGTSDEPYTVKNKYIKDENDEEYYNGIAYGTKTLARTWLLHGINRKVCKRPVMTLAYGSGRYGFSEQILEDTVKQSPLFKDMQKRASKYLAEKISLVVADVVVSAVEGMDFLKKLAQEMSKADIPVNWWTPLGLPVQQQYLKYDSKVLQTRLGAKRIRLYYNEVVEDENVDKNHQRNGIAPNFIHSLDSTHLMMVVNKANLSNYTTIHDSFGTSLGETKVLKRVLREELYRLYTEFTPLETFKAYVESEIGKSLPNIMLPKKGDLSLEEILKSEYIFH